MRKNDQRIRLTKMLIRRAFLDLLRTKPTVFFVRLLRERFRPTRSMRMTHLR